MKADLLSAASINGIVTLARGETINAEVIRYLNRLSDLLFVLARVYNSNGRDDVLWVPGKMASEK